MRTSVRRSLALVLLFFPLFGLAAAEESVQDFIGQLEKSLQSGDFETYLAAFSPELRDGERANLILAFDQMKMTTVSLHWANKGRADAAEPRVFLQVLFQNSFSAVVETWDLKLAQVDGRWQVKDKKARGNLSQLFKLQIPGGPVERVEAIEISHVDFRIVFRDALVFYDNIPELETALLVLGEGQLTFSPSDENEVHQLELNYKKQALEDTVDYAFLRFSKSYFERNIKIQKKADTSGREASQAELNKAAALFAKKKLDYFTIQSSLSPEPLSFLPQGDEAVIEFRGKKVGTLAYIYSPFAEEEITLYNVSRKRFVNLYSPQPDRGKKRLVITFGQKYDVQSYELEVDFQPEPSFLSAKAKISVKAEVDGLDALKLKFNPDLEILRIYDDERRELLFTQDRVGKAIYVYFLEPIDKNVQSSIEVFYRGRLEPPEQLTDTLVQARRSETVSFIPPRLDTYLFSPAAQWYPGPPDEDFFTARLKVIVPPEYSTLANGLLLQEGRLNGLQEVTEINKVGNSFSVFETKAPVKGLSFLVGKFSLLQQSQGSYPLFSYTASDVRSPKKNLLDDASKILEFYESRFGPFPFEALRIVQRLWTTAGGLSPASFIILNDLPRPADFGTNIILRPGQTGPVDLSQWREYYLAHEIAHQWWGQGVTSARYRDQWLSEGLAQFSAVLYLRSKYNHKTFAGILNKFSAWTEKKANWGPIILGSRLSFLDFDAYQAIIYDKTTLVLNMLLDLLGEEVFFTGLREFFAENKYAAAATGQFRRTMEKASGKDLADFFRPWFDSHALPQGRAAVSVIEAGEERLLRVRFDQLGEVFVFPLWIEWEESGRGLRREKVVVDKRSQEFDFPIQGNAAKIKVNPDKAVPGKIFFAGK